MKLTILYFAALREALGTGRETIELPPGIGTAGHLRAWLRERGDAWATSLAEHRAVRMAVDRVMAEPGTPLRDGAEVAFFPPVTGG
jgi:molybdopterin synthase sulfur carrier subunit